MLIRSPKNFRRGLVMIVAFVILFVFLLFPVLHDEMGNPQTGLQFADGVFNELAKGSSDFIPQVRELVKSVDGKSVEVSVLLKKPDLMQPAIAVLTKAGATAREEGGRLVFSGDLGTILANATDMSEKLYHNDGAAVSAMYDGMHHLEASRAWWYALSPAVKALQRQDLIAEAKVVDQVIRRAIEPGNNFYSLPAAKVSDHVLLLVIMLSFYILYTLWYGFSIFEFFEGFGLAMTKSKSKQES